MPEKISVPFVSLSWRVFNRFIKVFIAGGMSALFIAMHQVPAISDFEHFKTWIPVLAIAFMSGGIAALEKYISG